MQIQFRRGTGDKILISVAAMATTDRGKEISILLIVSEEQICLNVFKIIDLQPYCLSNVTMGSSKYHYSSISLQCPILKKC